LENPAADIAHESDDEQELPAPPSIVKPESAEPSQEVLVPNNTCALETNCVRPQNPSASRQTGPPAPYPCPAPPPKVWRSSRVRRTPIQDDDPCYFINAYEKSTLQMEQLPMQDIPESVGEIKVAETHGEAYKATVSCEGEPRTFNEAMSCPDADLWYVAMTEELKVFKKIGLYEVVEQPRDHKIVDSKWVYKIKCGPHGEIKCYKARLVAKGFTQVHGINYTDTFAPVMKFLTIQVFLALAAKYNLEIHQIDVKSAFLNGELEEEIYLHLPPGFCPTWYGSSNTLLMALSKLTSPGTRNYTPSVSLSASHTVMWIIQSSTSSRMAQSL
jgi:hypothetical protein